MRIVRTHITRMAIQEARATKACEIDGVFLDEQVIRVQAALVVTQMTDVVPIVLVRIERKHTAMTACHHQVMNENSNRIARVARLGDRYAIVTIVRGLQVLD